MQSRIAALAVVGALAAVPAVAPAQGAVERVEGRAGNGSSWAIERPANWNGAVLLYGRGYSPSVRPSPEVAAPGVREHLLKAGYALVASSYASGGWSVEDAVPSQLAALDAFESRFGEPKRVIAWGQSMGGLVSVALAERHPDRIDAAMPSCGSISGTMGMMNQALDGAFAFKTLIAPGSDIRVVGIDDDRVNGERVRQALTAARATPEGRARLSLAAVLAGLPPWSDTAAPEPAATDFAAQEAEAAKTFVMGVFLPRTDQERRAGGVFSWNTGVDYVAQLNRSGRRDFVEALYRQAGLDLGRDLATLNAAPRIAADPAAVAYMKANYTPTGALRVPVLSYHTIGDGMTPPNLQRAYAEMTAEAGRGRQFAGLFIRRAGHCTFTPAEHMVALETLEQRLATGRWRTQPLTLNARASALGAGQAAFIDYQPAAFVRPCSTRRASCAGEPRGKARK